MTYACPRHPTVTLACLGSRCSTVTAITRSSRRTPSARTSCPLTYSGPSSTSISRSESMARAKVNQGYALCQATSLDEHACVCTLVDVET